MISRLLSIARVGVLALPLAVLAQTPVQPAPDHEAMLTSGDARVVANKRLVYDFWREVWEAGHVELAEKYMAESYIQHNPNVPNGRAAFVGFLSRMRKPSAIEPRMKSPLVAITGDRDLVTLAFVREYPDPREAGKTYTTTWFDMFRIEGGKIAEHWDGATRPQAAQQQQPQPQPPSQPKP